jgi:hypothetical protein
MFQNRDDDPLDPMDPAAYSDVPRGTWTTGIYPQLTKKGLMDTFESQKRFYAFLVVLTYCLKCNLLVLGIGQQGTGT